MPYTRTVDAIEARVLGALLEKEQTTPDSYPMTINALLSACNQKSNRDPVMKLGEGALIEALDRLRADVLTWRSDGARAERWEHRVGTRWHLDTRAKKAIMTVLLLRGPQTPGELRTRTARMVDFADAEEVERVLEEMSEGPNPLVAEMARRPGQRETRYRHLMGSEEPQDESRPSGPARPDDPVPQVATERAIETASLSQPALDTRVRELESRLERVEARLDKLTEDLGG